jgi:hypothetical protein
MPRGSKGRYKNGGYRIECGGHWYSLHLAQQSEAENVDVLATKVLECYNSTSNVDVC